MKQKSSYFINRGGFCAIASMVCLILAIVFRIIGGIKYLGNTNDIIFEMILPAASCFLFILCIACFGKKGFWVSFIPVCLGAVYFILHVAMNGGSEALPLTDEFMPIYVSVCILVFVFGSSLYSATIFGGIRTKWIMVIYLLLCLAYQGAFRIYPSIMNGFSIEQFMPMLSVLCITLGLGFSTLGLRKLHVAKPVQESVVAPPIPGTELHNIPAAPTADKTDVQKHEEPDIIPTVVNDVKPELEPVIVQNNEPAVDEEAGEEETEAEPERTPAELPVSFSDKVKGLFGKKKADTITDDQDGKPDMNNVIEAIDSPIENEAEDETVNEIDEALNDTVEAVETASEEIERKANEENDAF